MSFRAGLSFDVEGREFLSAVIIAGEGIIQWAKRYADLAEAEAKTQTDPVRAAELRRMAEICQRVPAEPARDFQEALQSFWFAHIAMHIEPAPCAVAASMSADLSSGESGSIGQMSQEGERHEH